MTQDRDLCEISKHFYVWFNFAQSFWIVFQLPNEMPFHLIWKKKYRNSVCFGKFSLLFKNAMSRTKYKVNVKCVHSILERMQAPIFHVSSSALFVIKSDLFFNLFYINLLWIPHCIHPYTFRQRCNMFRHWDSFHKFPDIFFQKRHLDTLNSVKHKEKPILQKTLLVLFQFLTRIIDFQHKIFS